VSALETVVQNTYHRGFPQMYNSCDGSTSHGAYNPFEESFGAYDFKLETDGRHRTACTHRVRRLTLRRSATVLAIVANEWLTFQVGIKLGPRVGGRVQEQLRNAVDCARRQGLGAGDELGTYNLTAGSVGTAQKYGKVWLLPYNTSKSSSVTNPIAYTWYDELIISRNKIADP